ncbi:hypothetical protein JCM33374_g4002 [Metschnikowia sp. JCM 33374]|nr:hypothetical protein JCM33374_g4002 [Metschnikowia sp. JCM 33374]
MENIISEEKQPRLAIHDLNKRGHTDDAAKYDRRIADFPTNTSTTQKGSSRGIDRIYFPMSWRHRARTYQISKPEDIMSTHHAISVEFVLDINSKLQVGKLKFRYPLRMATCILMTFHTMKRRLLFKNLSM